QSARNVTDVGLKDLKHLMKLRKLDLNFTQVTDTGMEDISQMTNLEILGISHTKVTSAGLNKLQGLKKLHTLVYRTFGITNEDLGVLKEIRMLHILQCARTKKDGRPKNPDDVHSFNLESSAVTGEGLKYLAVFKNLEHLRLYGSPITDAGMKQVVAL